jgi:hypothetical protein
MRLARPLAILTLVSLVLTALPLGATAQVAGSRWTSPTYGFSVSWAGTSWENDPAGTLAGVGPEQLDRLHLVNGVSSLYFEGATRYAGELASCVAEEANLLSREPGVANVRPYLDANGVQLVASGPDAAAAAFTLTLDVGGQQLELIDYVECRTLIEGEAVLIVTLVTDPAAFERELEAATAVMDTITLAADIPLTPLEAYGGWLATAQEQPAIAGPLSGELAFAPGTLAVERVGVDAPDFYARIEFANPDPASVPAWDVGLGFRDSGGEEQMRLIVDSAGVWFLKDGLGPVIAQGVLVDLDDSAGGANIIELVAVGETGYFAFNERLVGEIDLSARMSGGNLFAGAGFFAEDAAVPGTARFQQFEIWSLSGLDVREPLVPAIDMNAAIFADWYTAASGSAPLAGPASGELVQRLGAAAVAPAGVDVEEFVAAATFINPSAADERPWDFGLAFREQQSGDHYRITVSSDGSWEYQIGLQPALAGGFVPALNFAEGARNSIEVVAAGSVAGFSVNGAFVAQLDLSALSGSSDVWVGAGFHRAGVTPDAATRFEGFAVWPLPPLAAQVPAAAPSPPQAPAPPSPPAPPAAPPAATPVAPSEAVLRETALRLHERGESGIDALAVLSANGPSTSVTINARDAQGGEVVALYDQRCDEPITMPLFLLEPLDERGSSVTEIEAPLADLTDGEHSLAIHRGPTDPEVVACGDIAASAPTG